MSSGGTRVAAEALRRFAAGIFVAEGMTGDHAGKVADVLVWADLRGVDSHGVRRIPRYVKMIEDGDLNPRPDIRIAGETAAALLVEADNAAGAIAMDWAMDRAMDKARAAGVGWALVRRMTHSGAIGYYTLKAARADMAGLAFVASLPNMAYHGARVGSVATSPIAIAVPGGDHAPLMLDMATAVAAGGRITQARNAGEPIPEGWALDAEGRPTTDAAQALVSLPIGGPKGAGLSLMMECLISLFVGNPIIASELAGRSPNRPIRQNGLCIAVDIATFIDPAAFKPEIERLIDTIKGLPRAEGFDEILVPGERGDRILEERARTGIPLSPANWKLLAEVADRLGLAMPETV